MTRLGCLAHVRRKFFDARSNDPKRADHALAVFKLIYEHDAKAKALDTDKRWAYRLKHIAPLYQRLKDWADEQALYATPKSPIGKAITYFQNQWPNLRTLFEDGRLLIDNNLIENKIRGINPFEWLTHTLERIADTKINDLHTLLPGYKPR